MPIANIQESLLVYDDAESASSPNRKHVDWKRTLTGIEFDQVVSLRFPLPPGGLRAVETPTGSDLTATPVTTTTPSAKPEWRKLTAPASWSSRISAGAGTLTISLDTTTGYLSLSGAVTLTGIQVGDYIYLPNASYGDSGVVADANAGFWVVVRKTPTALLLRRLYDGDPAGVAEAPTTTATGDVQHVSAASWPRYVFLRGESTWEGLHAVRGVGYGWLAVDEEGQSTLSTFTFSVYTALLRYIPYVRVEADRGITYAPQGPTPLPSVPQEILPLAADTECWTESLTVLDGFSVNNTGSTTAMVNVFYVVKE